MTSQTTTPVNHGLDDPAPPKNRVNRPFKRSKSSRATSVCRHRRSAARARLGERSGSFHQPDLTSDALIEPKSRWGARVGRIAVPRRRAYPIKQRGQAHIALINPLNSPSHGRPRWQKTTSADEPAVGAFNMNTCLEPEQFSDTSTAPFIDPGQVFLPCPSLRPQRFHRIQPRRAHRRHHAGGQADEHRHAECAERAVPRGLPGRPLTVVFSSQAIPAPIASRPSTATTHRPTRHPPILSTGRCTKPWHRQSRAASARAGSPPPCRG